jgi:hypothetical protein
MFALAKKVRSRRSSPMSLLPSWQMTDTFLLHMQLPYTDTVPTNKTWQPKANIKAEEENIALAKLYILVDKLLDTITKNIIIALIPKCREWQPYGSHGIRVWRPWRSSMKARLAPAPLGAAW